MPNLQIRGLEARDIPAASETLALAFASPKDYRSKLETQLRLAPGASLVALEEGLVVGTGSLVPYEGAAYIGMVAVRPDRQGRGVARALMESLLGLARSRGYATILLDASAAGFPLYAALGFEALDEVIVAHRPPQAAADQDGLAGERAGRSQKEASVTASARNAPPSGRILDELAAFDSARWGAGRRAYLEALAIAPGAAILEERGAEGRLEGYLLAQFDQAMLGPLLADGDEVGPRLLDRALAAWGGRDWNLIYPASNEGFASALAARGFVQVSRQTHMRLGPALRGRDRARILAQASLSLG